MRTIRWHGCPVLASPPHVLSPMHVARLKMELLSLSDTLLPKINNIHGDTNAERSAVQWLTMLDISSHAEDAQRKKRRKEDGQACSARKIPSVDCAGRRMIDKGACYSTKIMRSSSTFAGRVSTMYTSTSTFRSWTLCSKTTLMRLPCSMHRLSSKPVLL